METKKVYYPLLDNYRKIENIFGLDFVKKSEFIVVLAVNISTPFI